MGNTEMNTMPLVNKRHECIRVHFNNAWLMSSSQSVKMIGVFDNLEVKNG